MHDVIVIGAGPAGSEVAYRLASLGHDVLVLEKDRLDREKPCGGAIQGVEIEEFGRPPSNVVEKEIHSARLYDCKGNSLLVPLKPYGVSVRRGKYDRWLQTRAEKEGAKFQENTEVKRVRLGKFPEVQTSDESKICKFIVDASGANDIIRRSRKD